MHRDSSSGPTTPVKSRTRTRSRTQTVTKQSPGKFMTRTTTTIRTTTVVVGNPSSSSQPTPSQISSTPDDSDDPNEDATISLATDSDDDHTPTIVSTTPPVSTALSSRLSHSLPPASSLPTFSPAPSRLERDTEDRLAAYYERRYPGKVPHPDTLVPSASSPASYYVVTAGVQSDHHIVTLPPLDHLPQQMDTDTHSSTSTSQSFDGVIINPLVSNADAEPPTTPDTTQPLTSNADSGPLECETTQLPPKQPELGDEETMLQNLVLTQHQVAGKSWGTGNAGWGNDFESTEHAWATTIPSPRIVSLTTGRGWGDGYGESVFQWRTQASSGKPSHKHIVLYARRDLHRILRPLGERKDNGLSGVASDKWARTLIVRSLPEAQHAQVPGPYFTLAEVRERLAQVDADVSAAKASVDRNLERLSAIKAEQEPLRSALRALDNERASLLDKNEEKERTLKDLAEVQEDLKDLEALALAFC
ncbi:hypothetical protein PQX77_011588 [Marasmius sp. AFHP31]|nr:hypothetical protein PQX77_018848 [Marasmius sp. AFHP31]KAK1225475.1 hypothetical protein PQX77_011588 [Marasmius sp. AFHP31]